MDTPPPLSELRPEWATAGQMRIHVSRHNNGDPYVVKTFAMDIEVSDYYSLQMEFEFGDYVSTTDPEYLLRQSKREEPQRFDIRWPVYSTVK